MMMMKGLTRILPLGLALLLGLLVTPALAAGPVDGEVGASWWANDYDANSNSSSAGAPGFRAELWLHDRYGMRGSMYSSNPDQSGVESSDYTSLDLLWKAIAPKENSYFAVGMGWQQMDTLGLDSDTTGLRVALEGHIGITGPFAGYGEAAYLPSLSDQAASNPANGRFTNMDGIEYELGVAWKAAPFISVRAGYRQTSVDYTQTGVGPSDVSGSVDSKGFLAGVGVQF